MDSFVNEDRKQVARKKMDAKVVASLFSPCTRYNVCVYGRYIVVVGG